MSSAIRPARGDDLGRLREIERAAGAAFRALGMDAIADDAPPSLRVLETFRADGRAWVAVGADDRPVAYLLAEVLDATVHVAQVSVHPGSAGRRLGAALIDAAAVWGVERGLAAVTLTTFADVPWNAPYYARLGFTTVGEDDLGDGLRTVRAHEAAVGLDRWPRVVMRRAASQAPDAGALASRHDPF